MGIIYQQNFDALTAGTLPAGWTQKAGTWAVSTTTPEDAPNAFGEASPTDGDFVIRTGDALPAAQAIQLIQKYVGTAAQVDPIFRDDGTGNNHYLITLTFSTRTAILWKKVGGSYSTISSQTWPANYFAGATRDLASGDFYWIKVDANGSTVNLKLWLSTDTEPGSATLSFTDTTYASGSSWGLRTGSPSTGVALSIDDIYAGDSGTNFLGGISVSVTDTGFFFSPYNWHLNGSTYAQTNAPGAYAYFTFITTATGTPTLNVDVSPLTGGSVPSGSYPSIRYRLNNGTWTDRQLLSTDTAISLGSLGAGTYTLTVYILNADQAQDRWTMPAEVVRITGATIPVGSTTSAPATRAKRILVYGDSITEGIYVTAASVPGGGDSTATYVVGLAAAIGAEVGVVGYGGQGWTIAGQGNVPTFPNAWNLYWAATSRLSGGLLSPTPDKIFIIHGANDGLQGASDAAVTTAVASLIPSIRAASPNATVNIVAPFGGFKAAAIQQGVINAADANTFFRNLGTEFAAGLSGPQGTPTFRSPADGIHLDTRAHGEAGARLVVLGDGSGPVPMIGNPLIRGAA